MRTPTYWKDRNLTSDILLPLGKLYALATALRLKWQHPKHASVPVICIGNLTAGGSGKTPTALSLARMLLDKGKKPFFVSRGYGGKLTGVRVDPARHTAAEVGDEPLLLSRLAPVIVNPDRYAAAQMAVKEGADVIIMDDGFQNPGLYKDLSLLVFDGSFGFGNGRPVPAGPLRENLAAGLKRAQGIIVIGNDDCNLSALAPDLPHFHGRVIATPLKQAPTEVIAFAGIGRPQKFYDSLRQCGLNPLKTHDFPDHHFYTRAELEAILQEATELQAPVYTTTKDFVKIPAELQKSFNVLEIDIAWENPEKLQTFILKKAGLL